VGTIAEVDGEAAAKEALPINMLCAMLLAHGLARSIRLHLTPLAQQVFLRRRLAHSEVGLAITQATKERFLAPSTLVKSALLHRESQD